MIRSGSLPVMSVHDEIIFVDYTDDPVTDHGEALLNQEAMALLDPAERAQVIAANRRINIVLTTERMARLMNEMNIIMRR